MLGTLVNATAIFAGGIFGLCSRKQPSVAFQNYLKLGLGCAAMFFGLRMVWQSVNGAWHQVGWQLMVVLLALILGRLLGRILRLQKISNRWGRSARDTLAHTKPQDPTAWSGGFNTCTILFCAAPLAALGAVADGLGGCFQPLLVKAVMDGLAALGFTALFRWGVALTALPVLAYQGTLTLLCAQYARPFLERHHLLDSVMATDGLLVVFVGLVIFEVRKIELADYLPALAVAPLLTWLWP
jgi:uncharacterized membrane protein YqgA involved in biofilm formation